MLKTIFLIHLALFAFKNVNAKPNILFFLTDDMGYGDMGVNGQAQFTTPNLDKLAQDGLLFTQFYSGSTVCGPSRITVMQGLHTGHSAANGNQNGTVVGKDEITIGKVIKWAGYKTAYFGKWGNWVKPPTDQAAVTISDPQDHGFDYFLGYLAHGHAHNCYPPFIIYNQDTLHLRNKLASQWEVPHPEFYGRGVATEKVDFVPFILRDSAVSFITRQAQDTVPFFLYYAPNIPHANNEAGANGMEVPDYGEFTNQTGWSDNKKGFAQMMRYIDNDMGIFVSLLDSLGMGNNTLILFSSDNGPHSEGGHKVADFDSNGPLKGFKRDLFEGGVRVPTIAWWPGIIGAGRVTDLKGYFPDILPTFAELAGVSKPSNIDGISFVKELIGDTASQEKHSALIWRFGDQNEYSVLTDQWKYVNERGTDYLYDLSQDIGETNNLASTNPDVVAQMINIYNSNVSAQPVTVLWTPQLVPPAVVAAGNSRVIPNTKRTKYRLKSYLNHFPDSEKRNIIGRSGINRGIAVTE